jgi:integrase
MPRIKLTSANQDTLPAIDGERTDYADTLCPGLILRVSMKNRVWVITYRIKVNGEWKTPKTKLGRRPRMGLQEAREAARQKLSLRDSGEDPRKKPEPETKGLTVLELVEKSIAAKKVRTRKKPLSKKSIEDWEQITKADIKGSSIGDRDAATLTEAEVKAWVAKIKKRSKSMSAHAFAVVRQAYSWVMQELEDQDEDDATVKALAAKLIVSPCARIRNPFKSRASTRVLSHDELWALMRALSRARGEGRKAYADATWLLLLTHVRRASVIGIRRDELVRLDGSEPRWVIPGYDERIDRRTKNARDHVVPLSPMAVEIIQRRLRMIRGQYLFPAGGYRRGKDKPVTWESKWPAWLKVRVNRTVNALRRRRGDPTAPVPKWTIHNFRHTMTTHMREELRVTGDVTSVLLQHTKRGFSDADAIYDRSELLPDRRVALEAWARWLEALRMGKDDASRVLAFRTR